MTQENPKKMPVRNLERFSERKFNSYEAAKTTLAIVTADPATTTSKELVAKLAKAKIFARNDGTFDLVFYKKIGVVSKEQVTESMDTAKAADAVVSVKKVPFKKGKKQHA